LNGIRPDLYQRLKELSIELPKTPARGGLYAPVKQSGTTLFVSGHIPNADGKVVFAGKVGAERTVEEGQAAARLCILNILSQLHAFLGDLNRLKGPVRILAWVASAPGFGGQPVVVDAASQLLIDLFGEEGWCARSAIGTNELPLDVTVEIEAVFELKA
jgi:enamine deaminase RidA (YjgF/YER057c/UK114 family)